MRGFAHIFRLGLREGTYGQTIPEFQFTFNQGGKTWVRTFPDESLLAEFLHSDVAVPPDVVQTAVDELHRTGRAIITDVEIRESEAPAMGLEELPSDY